MADYLSMGRMFYENASVLEKNIYMDYRYIKHIHMNKQRS